MDRGNGMFWNKLLFNCPDLLHLINPITTAHIDQDCPIENPACIKIFQPELISNNSPLLERQCYRYLRFSFLALYIANRSCQEFLWRFEDEEDVDLFEVDVCEIESVDKCAVTAKGSPSEIHQELSSCVDHLLHDSGSSFVLTILNHVPFQRLDLLCQHRSYTQTFRCQVH